MRDLGEIEQAIALLKRAQTLAPHDADLLQNLGNTYWVAEQYQAAIDIFNTLYLQNKNNEDIRDSLLSVLSLAGNQAHAQGDFSLAQHCFQQAVSISAQAELLYNLANAERELGLLTAARQHYLQAQMLSASAPQIPFLGPFPNGSIRQGPIPQIRQQRPADPNPHCGCVS